MEINQTSIGLAIAKKLTARQDVYRRMWEAADPFRCFTADDLLPPDEVRTLADRFPRLEEMSRSSTLYERKRFGVDLNRYDPRIQEFVLAFQHPDVVRTIADITGLHTIQPDPTLYASGISMMGTGDFLNPHLDNSHDGDGKKVRVLNLLFYISSGWKLENGGNLELWNPAITKARTLHSQFNRLIVMETNERSWHSVSPVTAEGARCCVSNYYFSETSPWDNSGRRWFTIYAGRPEEKLTRILLTGDRWAKKVWKKFFPKSVVKSTHRTTWTKSKGN